ncbi:hypothetical protein O3P69_008902 [Scylla paramamosain]|uniref:Uncharacterized protein n=1 Tax=Scylla paramamosain TaxID=85552 RepID=A0AAW0TPQ1_SCYPA
MLFKARSFGATQQQLVQLYCQRIRPVLEYACPVWHSGLTTAQRATLKRVQKRLLPQRAPSRYQTRHSARLSPVRCRTERYRNSTIPYVTRLANK